MFLWSLLIGGVFIALYGPRRFNIPSYAEIDGASRLVALIEPVRARHGRIVWRARIFYVAAMLALFTILTVFLRVVLLGIEGTDFGAKADRFLSAYWLDAEKRELLPMVIALGLFGFHKLPVSVFENSVRRLSHSVAGIPHRLLSGTEVLKSGKLELPRHRRTLSNDLALTVDDWSLISALEALPEGTVSDKTAFLSDLCKIACFRRWICEERKRFLVRGAPDATREQREHVEREAATFWTQVTILHEAWKVSPAAALMAGEWREKTRVADRLATDACCLFMLDSEHGAVERNEAALAKVEQIEARGGGGIITTETAVKGLLTRFLQGVRSWRDVSVTLAVVWFGAATAACVTTAAFALPSLLNDPRLDPSADTGTFLIYWGLFVLSAISIYPATLAVALMIYRGQPGGSGADGTAAWREMMEPQLSGVATITTLRRLAAISMGVFVTGFVCLIALNFAHLFATNPETARQTGAFELVAKASWTTVSILLAPVILALGVVLLVDLWRAGRLASGASSLILGTTAAIALVAGAMFVWDTLRLSQLAAGLCAATPDARGCDVLQVYATAGEVVAGRASDLAVAVIRSCAIGAAALIAALRVLRRTSAQGTAPVPDAAAAVRI